MVNSSEISGECIQQFLTSIPIILKGAAVALVSVNDDGKGARIGKGEVQSFSRL